MIMTSLALSVIRINPYLEQHPNLLHICSNIEFYCLEIFYAKHPDFDRRVPTDINDNNMGCHIMTTHQTNPVSSGDGKKNQKGTRVLQNSIL